MGQDQVCGGVSVLCWYVENALKPWTLLSRNFLMTSEEFFKPKIIDIAFAKSREFTVYWNKKV